MEQLAALISDITQFSDGTTDYEGITSADPRVNSAELNPIRRTGRKYATEIDETHSEDFPVVVGISTRDALAMLPLLAAPQGTWTIKGQASDGDIATVPISNGKFRKPRMRWDNRPSSYGTVDLELVAVSTDGTALPIAVTKAAS